MFERLNPVLRMTCLVLAALLVFQFSRLAASKDPLADVKLPVPSVNTIGSNATPAAVSGVKETNAPGPATNAAPVPETAKGATNAPPVSKGMPPASRGKMPGSRPTSGTPMPDLPPAVQARVERITQSEILGQVIRPLPMALLGIAGRDAFLRAPNGQTGLVKEGDELGGIKLLRIGTNRVLIEHEGQKKELTVFSGFGSDTLLPKGKENSK
jgi:hypothetical protein